MAHRKSQLRRQIQLLNPQNSQWVDVGIADKFTGGDLKTEAETYPRGDGTKLKLGGDLERENATAVYLLDGRFAAILPIVERAAGLTGNIRVLTTKIGDDKRPDPTFRPYTLTGGLLGVSEPESGGGENGGAEVTLSLELDEEKVF